MRTLLQAGMTAVQALETMVAQGEATHEGSEHVEASARALRHLREGKPLSESLELAGGFPPLMVAGVRASERTSALVAALDDYLRYDELLGRLRRQVVSAALYPAIVVSLGAVVCTVLLLVVVPRFAQIYAEARGPASDATHWLLAASRLLSTHGGWVAGGLAGVILSFAWLWRSGRLSAAVGRWISAIGPLQRRVDDYRLAQFYQSLSIMFRGGFPLDEALAQCAALGMDARMSGRVLRAREAVVRGVAVSTALGDAGLADVTAARLISVGEQGGSFDHVLQAIADRHAAAFALFIERATRIVEPMLMLLVALVVGGIVLMMYMPIFDIASSLG